MKRDRIRARRSIDPHAVCTLVILQMCTIVCVAKPAYAQARPSSWTGGAGNNLWSNGQNWSTDPKSPQNGPGETFDVTIARAGADVLLDLDPAFIDRLTLDGRLTVGRPIAGASLLVQGHETVGAAGQGVFQAGGANFGGVVNAVHNLTLGRDAGSDGTYDLFPNSLLSIGQVAGDGFAGGALVVGLWGKGTFNHKGAVDVSGSLWVGKERDAVNPQISVYNLEVGAGPGEVGPGLSVEGNINVGVGGFGDFNHKRGNVFTGPIGVPEGFGLGFGNLYVGKLVERQGVVSVGDGRYTLTSGKLNVAENLEIAAAGSHGLFTQNGGEVETTDLIVWPGKFVAIGQAESQYRIANGTLRVKKDLGNFGFFGQSGGVVTVEGKMAVMVDGDPGHHYDLLGGTLKTTNEVWLANGNTDAIKVRGSGVWKDMGGKILKQGPRASVKIENGGLLDLAGPDGEPGFGGVAVAAKQISGVGFSNFGTIAVSHPIGITLDDGAGIDNVGLVDFRNDGSITGSGPGAALSLKLVGPDQDAILDAAGSVEGFGTIRKSGGSGTSVVGVGVEVSGAGTIDVQTGTLQLAGPVSMPQGGALNKFGNATLRISGPQSYNGGGFSVNAGVVRFDSDAGAGPGVNPSFTLNPGTSLVLDSTQHLHGIEAFGTARVTLTAGAAGGDKVLVTGLMPLGTDLTNNAGIVDWSVVGPNPSLPLHGQVGAAYAGGTWSGRGIGSSLANSATFGIGILDNSSFAYTSFFGETIDSSATLLAFTRYGDANLDFAVNGADLAILNQYLGQSGRAWWHGDFNYDGWVNDADMTLWQINSGGGPGLMSFAAASALSLNADLAPVPEPSILAILAVIGGGVGLRPRRGRSASRGAA